MTGFSVLSNRRRALIALLHSVVFLLIAVRQMMAATPARGIWVRASVPLSTWILCGVFVVVSAILLWLFVISRHWTEKVYFGLCTVSASAGLVRIIFGDHVFHAGLYLRVIMLGSAVLVGSAIVKMHAQASARLAWNEGQSEELSPELAEGRHTGEPELEAEL